MLLLKDSRSEQPAGVTAFSGTCPAGSDCGIDLCMRGVVQRVLRRLDLNPTARALLQMLRRERQLPPSRRGRNCKHHRFYKE